MNRRLLLVIGGSALLAGCASTPRTVEISREQLQADLARRFPMQERYLELLDVRASRPRVQTLPESNRLRVQVALAATDRILRRTLDGELDLSFGLLWEAADASMRMADVRVERLDLSGLPPALQGHGLRLGAFLAERLLEDSVLHRFSAEELARARGFAPGEIRVTRRGVAITLLPPVR
jgi:hypothetical protein